MSEIKHSEYCQNHLQASIDANAAWFAKWPDACRRCQGAGEIGYSYDPSPAGVSLSSGTIEGADPCECMEDDGKCPRCGAPLYPGLMTESEYDEWFGHQEPCPRCGWQHGLNPDDTAPAIYECECWALPMNNPDVVW